MQDKGGGSKTMTWIAACVFSLILGVVLIAFQPARELVCSRYEVEGVVRILAFVRGSETACFWGFVYDFQTLIGGMLAIGAAGWTVAAMRLADINSEKRHQEIIRFGLRADRTLIERATNPQFAHLDYIAKEITFKETLLRDAKGKPELLSQFLSNEGDFIGTFSKELVSILKRDAIADASKLFPGQLHFIILTVRERADMAIPIVDRARADLIRVKRNTHEQERYYQWLDSVYDNIWIYLISVRPLLLQLLNELSNLAAEYGVSVDQTDLEARGLSFEVTIEALQRHGEM